MTSLGSPRDGETTYMRYLGERRFGVEDAPTPEPAAGEVVLEITATGVCGSDIHGYMGLNNRRPPGVVMGHETTGRVIAVGPGVDMQLGTQVVVWPIVACGVCARCAAGEEHLCVSRRLYGCVPELPGGFATKMRVNAANCISLPTSIPPEWGALVEPLAVGQHAVALAAPSANEASVVVIGGGAIGIAAALAARRVAAHVTVIEPRESRRVVLSKLGISTVTPDESPVQVDVAIECVGLESTLKAAIASTRAGGCVVCVGLAAAAVELRMEPLVIGERRLLGSSAYTRADFQAVIDSCTSDGIDLGAMVQRRVNLEELPSAFADYAAGAEVAVRTILSLA